MGAGIIEFISNIVNITGNPIADTIIFAIIGSIAFGFVEMLFDFTGKYNSKDMSDVHWGVRILVFALLTFVLVKIAQFVRWIFSAPQVYFLLGFIVLVILLIVFRLVYKNKKKIIDVEKHIEVKVSQKPENDIKDSTQDDSQNIKAKSIVHIVVAIWLKEKDHMENFLDALIIQNANIQETMNESR